MKKSGQIIIVPLFLLAAALSIFSGCRAGHRNPEAIAVSNSWLEGCVSDIAGPNESIIRLTPPGSCPGHFDLKPSAAAARRSCRILLRFDFQQSLDDKINSPGLEVVSIGAPKGLCVPDNYLHACEKVHEVLCRAWPQRRSKVNSGLKQAEERLQKLEQEVQQMIHEAGIAGATVVTSGHQAEFAKWLGLNVIATYSGAEATSPRELEGVIKQGKASNVQVVIANLQEGRAMADSLAYHLEVPVACFSNFPAMTGRETTFDALVRHNVFSLLKAVEESS